MCVCMHLCGVSGRVCVFVRDWWCVCDLICVCLVAN